MGEAMTASRPAVLGRKLPKRARAVMVVLIGCAAVIIATTGFILVQIIRMQVQRVGEAVTSEEVTAPPPEHHAAPTAAPFTEPYELQGMTISLGNRNQTLAAYAEFNLVLDCPDKESKRWMQMNRASIRDAVYESTISFTVEDFTTPEGFSRIKKAILETLKTRFGARAPRDVAIRDWIIR
jgi:flagellar basal body-associated protein FliL